MPDDSSKAAMQAFGVIPNAYFDLIARVMPGFLLLFGISCESHKSAIGGTTDIFIPREFRGSSVNNPFSLLAAFVINQSVLGGASFTRRNPR